MKQLPVLVFVLAAAPAAYGAPKVDFLFPAGGQRGMSVDVRVSGAFEAWPVSSWTSHPGITIQPGKVSGQATFAIAADVPCGVHWVRFFDKSGASGLRPFLVNQLPEMAEKEPNDDFKKPHEIAGLPLVMNGALAKADDVDHFAVPLKKGQTLIAAVEAFHNLRSPMDVVMQVVSTDGFVLAHNDDYTDIDPFLAFETPRDGLYLIRLFCFPSTPKTGVSLFGKESCIYRLTLTTGPYVDHAWPLAVERGKAVDIDLVGWNLPKELRRFPVDPAVREERVRLQPPGFANGVWVHTEPHRVAVLPEKVGVPPFSVNGMLTKPGDRAVIPFAGIKGKELSIAVESRQYHFPLDPVLVIRDASGRSLQKVQAAKLNSDTNLDFTPSKDGNYSLEVRDLHDSGGPRHVFVARVQVAQPDFEFTVATDRFVAIAKQPLEIPLTTVFHRGMKGPFEFRAEGLPASARLEFVAGKDAKKATLRIQGLNEAFIGPVRFWASAPNHGERSISSAEWNRPNFWINVQEK